HSLRAGLSAQKVAGALPTEPAPTPRVRKLLVRAQNEAGRLGHAQVRPEHLLLALLGDDECMAELTLERSLDVTALRATISPDVTERRNGPGATQESPGAGDAPFVSFINPGLRLGRWAEHPPRKRAKSS